MSFRNLTYRRTISFNTSLKKLPDYINTIGLSLNADETIIVERYTIEGIARVEIKTYRKAYWLERLGLY